VRILEYGPPRGLSLRLINVIKDFPSVTLELPCLVHVMTTTANRNDTMTSIDSTHVHPDGIGAVLAAANLNARRNSDLASAAGQVVAKRVSLGFAGALSPSTADRVEFARMVPEKVEAFSAAGMIMLHQSGKVSRTLMRLASDEIQARAGAANVVLEGGVTPARLATIQHQFMVAWFARASAGFIAMGMLGLQAHDAVMAPIREQVAVNVDRLAA
jgi:hypothetical protein